MTNNNKLNISTRCTDVATLKSIFGEKAVTYDKNNDRYDVKPPWLREKKSDD